MSESKDFTVSLQLLENFVFKADFGEFGYIITDEPAPLGNGEGPNPARLVATGVANCLAASLLFALQRKKQRPKSLSAKAQGELKKIDGFWRIAHIDVSLDIDVEELDKAILQQSLALFEDYCIVTQSIRTGFPVNVSVTDQAGNTLQ
ncbi:MAG: OsmC family protein [Pseudomonadales bacterium]|nr:OsmC family protein [Pseudomonadales bacterium]